MADNNIEDDRTPEAPLEERTLVERLARYLATRKVEPMPSQADAWPNHIEAAASLLAVIKDPDAHMLEVGDLHVWQRMIDAALVKRWNLDKALGEGRGEPPSGFDEEGEVPFTEHAPGVEKTPSWVQESDPPKP